MKGPAATVDTDGDFHTYHIEVSAAGVVSVLYDGTPKLSGFTFGNGDVFGPTRRILWGEGADEAFGTSLWEFVYHNGAVCPGGSTTTSTTGASTTTTSTTSSTTVIGTTTTSSSSLPTGTTFVPPTSTTKSSSTTTTTTQPSDECDATAGSLDDVLCRLDLLRARIVAESGLGKFQAKLLQQVGKAIARAQEASAACTSGDEKKAKRGLKQAQRQLINFSHRLRGLAARKQLDPTLRTDMADDANAIRTDLGTLRGAPCAG